MKLFSSVFDKKVGEFIKEEFEHLELTGLEFVGNYIVTMKVDMQEKKELLGKAILAIAIIIASLIIKEAIIEAAGIIGSQIASAIAIK